MQPINPASRRKSNRPRAKTIPKLNDRVEIWWAEDETYYRGTITQQFKPKTFRILYDDGETEDLDLTREEWRFAADTSTQPPNSSQTMAFDVVETVLDGSADAPPPKPKDLPADHQKTSAELSLRKHDKEPSTSPISTSEPRKQPRSVPVVHSLKDNATPEPKKNHTPSKQTDKTTSSAKPDPALSSTPSNSSRSASTKTRPKQKFARIRKDVSTGSISKSKHRKISTGSSEFPTSTGNFGSRPAPSREEEITCTSKGQTEGRPQPTKKPMLARPGGGRGDDTRVEMGKNEPKKIAPAASSDKPTKVVSKSLEPHSTASAPSIVVSDKDNRKAHVHSPKPSKANVPVKPQGKDNHVESFISTQKQVPTPATPATMAKRKPDPTTPKQQPVIPKVKETVPKSKQKPASTPLSAGKPANLGEPRYTAILPTPHEPIALSHKVVEGRGKGDPFPQGNSAVMTDNVAKPPTTKPAARIPDTDSTMKVSRKEDSYRSRSSSEKPSSSAAHDRRKKRRKSLSGQKSGLSEKGSSVTATAQDQSLGKPDANRGKQETSQAGLPDIEKRETSKARVAETLPATAESHTKVDASKNLNLNVKRKRLETGQVIPRESKTTLMMTKDNPRTKTLGNNSSNVPPAVPSNVQAIASTPESRLHVKVDEDPSTRRLRSGAEESGPPRQKRQRVEHTQGPQSVKRVKTQSDRDCATVPEPEQATEVVPPGASVGRREMLELGQELISSVSGQLETVSRDVKGLVSMSLKFRQDTEFYKDVVHRSVVEESSKIRGALQDMRNEFFNFIDDRAKQTEYNIMQRIHEAFASFSGYDRCNGSVPPHHNTPLPDQVPGAERHGVQPVLQQVNAREAPNYANTDERLARNTHEPTGQVFRNDTTNGHNGSPTAIANVNQGAPRDARSHGRNNRDAVKESQEAVGEGTFAGRVSHLVARQVTVWLLETPHEYNPRQGSVPEWAHRTAASTFDKVAGRLRQFTSYMQAYQLLSSSLGNDAVELQWFVTPGAQENLRRARRNYAAWDPPPSDEEWFAEMSLLREVAERFDRVMRKYNRGNKSMIEACVEIAQLGASDEPVGYQTTNGRSN